MCENSVMDENAVLFEKTRVIHEAQRANIVDAGVLSVLNNVVLDTDGYLNSDFGTCVSRFSQNSTTWTAENYTIWLPTPTPKPLSKDARAGKIKMCSREKSNS